MRHKFETQLMELRKKIVGMSDLVRNAVELAIQSLKERDLEIAEKIVANDVNINNAEREIEQLCTHLVATQQPFASDLRKIVASYKIIASLERMGDLAVDIAKLSLRIGPVPLIKPLIDLPKMTEIVLKMIHTAVEAFINEDIEMARSLADMDHEVDHYYKRVFTELNEMMAKDASLAAQGVYILLTTRYMERIGDYCTNIGEEVIYMDLGVREDLNM
ncbi:MAG: phosphate signaling complex protein PhoU [Peptococcaceae bacterium]|nr:phosphate signaling complex protein PhoU [Peptococcaceae bacterium]